MDFSQLMMMQSVMGGGKMDPLLMTTMMGGNTDDYIRARGMASVLKGDELDNDSVALPFLLFSSLSPHSTTQHAPPQVLSL